MNDQQYAMGCSHGAGDQSLKHEAPDAADTSQAMASRNRLLFDRLVYSCETKTEVADISPARFIREVNGLEVSDHQIDCIRKGQNGAKSKEEHMGISVDAECSSVANTCSGLEHYRNLRLGDLLQLLNSTQIGQVINERQLYRHRREANCVGSVPNRIDLFKYIAWLMHRRESGKRRKNQRTKASFVLSMPEAREILKRQGYRCALSGVSLSPEDLALDHIVPVSEGGDFSASNAQFVTKTVNRAKHTMSQQEFILMCRRIASHQHPQKPVSIQGQQRTLWD